LCRLKRAYNRDAIDFGVCESSGEVVEANPEKCREGERVVGQYPTDPRLPKRAASELLKAIDGAEI
jgi:hypothetical protein